MPEQRTDIPTDTSEPSGDAAGGAGAIPAASLLPQVYRELRALAESRLRRLPPGQTLQPTALVHEAYMRLVGSADPGWNGRGHFFGAAARAMRNILVDEARRKGAEKRGGGRLRVDLPDSALAAITRHADMLELDEALERLEQIDERKGSVVMLRVFCGLTIDQTAMALGLSAATVERDWAYAKAWLHRELKRVQEEEGT